MQLLKRIDGGADGAHGHWPLVRVKEATLATKSGDTSAMIAVLYNIE